MKGKTLRICEMPVEHIHLGVAHGVNQGLDHVNRDEIPKEILMNITLYITEFKMYLAVSNMTPLCL